MLSNVSQMKQSEKNGGAQDEVGPEAAPIEVVRYALKEVQPPSNAFCKSEWWEQTVKLYTDWDRLCFGR